MPPFIQVQSLYGSCLGAVFDCLHGTVEKSSESVEPLRKLVQSTLHAGIREHLVQIATMHCRNNSYILLDLLGVLLDKAIRRLDHSRGNDDAWLPVEQCAGLFCRLDQCQATGLHELTVKVRLDPRRGGDLETVSSANISFHRVLRNGLAASLQSLVLRSVCDNETLRLLGKFCPHLRNLDATSSWLVDDGGLRQLCFKDPECYAPTSETYFELNGSLLYTFLSVLPSELNSCCQTLQQVRIQDTNTSEVGVVMLLLFMPNLKSLGGFIYYRNVGDAILSLQSCRRDLRLGLTDLWDTCLPPEKAAQLGRAIPLLGSLYTRGSWLPSVTHFPALTAITVDFDFVDFAPLLEKYLVQNGALLKKLVIVDQTHPVDLAMLAETCPALEELGAKLMGGWSSNTSMLPCLSTCRVRVGSTEPLTSLLVYAHNLTHLEISLEEDSYGDGLEQLDDSVISHALAENPSPSKLQVFLINSECFLSIHTAQLLMTACQNLRFMGELQLWAGMCDRDVEELCREVQDRNLDLMVRYRGSWYPYRRGCLFRALQN